MITFSDAGLLIAKFQTESTSVGVLFIGKSLTVWLQATVADFAEGSHVKLKALNGDCCKVDLRGCQYDYGDTRAAPECFRQSLAEVAGILGILLPSGECLYVVEMS